jgi:hypothetical protein
MAKTTEAPLKLATIWGDTVDMKHLGGAMVIGIILGFVFYKGGLLIIDTHFSQLAKNLHTSIALLIGIIGCLLAAVVSAKLFLPKRTMSEQAFSPEDRKRVLQELQINLAEEAAELKVTPADTIREMRDLQLLDIFQESTEPAGPKGE